jgi:hypothetical protein
MGTNEGDTPPPPQPSEDLPATELASLVTRAKERVLPEPDRHGPAAVRAMAAVVRDLKGMPELQVVRETGTRIKLSRKNKVGWIVIEYDPKILVMEVSIGGFSDLPNEPGSPKAHRHTLQDNVWTRLDGGGDLFSEIRQYIIRLYPELAEE